MKRPIETAEDLEELKYLQSIDRIRKEDRYRIKTFHHKFINDSYVCPTCDDAIWNALKRIKGLNYEALLLKLHYDAAERVKQYQNEQREEKKSKKEKKKDAKEGEG